jgi:predicted aldo/keto reductase-like oxidoreductase
VEWAFRWIWDQPEISVALSGMSSMDQLMENLDIAQEAKSGCLTKDDNEIIERVSVIYRTMLKVDCTNCAYCMPCPSSVNIPMNFSLYNDMHMFKDPEINIMLYNYMLPPEQRASNCIECGRCEELCTQRIRIIEELKNVHEVLSQEQ